MFHIQALQEHLDLRHETIKCTCIKCVVPHIIYLFTGKYFYNKLLIYLLVNNVLSYIIN